MKFKKLLTGIIAASMLSSFMPTSKVVSAEVITPEPVMKVTFDNGDADDITGRGNNGEVVGNPEFVQGKKGKAIHLVNSESVAGSSKNAEQYVDFGEREDLKFGEYDFSIAFWYKSDINQGREGAVISNKDWATGGNPGFNIGNMNQGLNLNFNTEGNSGRAETDRFGSATDGKWHHITAVVDRDDKMSLYIDGEEAEGGAGFQSQSYCVDISKRKGSVDVLNFVVGADGNKKYGVKDSYVDELEVYKKALTKAEIKEISKIEEEEIIKEPVLKVSFDENNANDLSGNNNHGILAGNPEFVEGVEGKAIHLTNSEGVAGEHREAEQYVDFGNSEELKFGTEDFSIMFWYKSNGEDNEEVSVLSNKDWTTGGNTGFAIGDMRNGMTLNFTANGGSRQDTNRITAATDNKWHHITATFNRTGSMVLYVDGEMYTSTNISKQKGKSIDVSNFVLGADGMKRYGVKDSYIDELQVYKDVLTPEEIEDINAPYVLRNKIEEYEKILNESTASEEKKNAFRAVIENVKKELGEVDDINKIKALSDKLNRAFNDFSGPEGGLIEFEVLSDVHISGEDNSSRSNANLIDAIKDVKKYFPNSSGIMNSGDFSDNGYEHQYKGYFDILEEYGNGLNFLTALGNHDVRWKSGWEEVYNRYMKYNEKYMGETNGKVYYDKWIDGYHFIVINTEWDIKDRAYISPEQLKWLDETMAEGAEDGKPIFLFLHQAMRDTYWNSNDWDIGMQDFALKEVLRKYPQNIMFTGHIHNGLGALDAIKTDYGTMVDVPGFYSNDYGDTRGQIGYHVTVHEDKVELSMRDYKNDLWMPEHNLTINLEKNPVKTKILDVDFDNETAEDSSEYGNHGTIVGKPEFVEGINGGKAIRISNLEEEATQYVEFKEESGLKLGEDDFSILFWYKENEAGGSIFSNKDLSSDYNKGVSISSYLGDERGLGLTFNTTGKESIKTNKFSNINDGKWHQISASFERSSYMTLYIDGKEVERKDIREHLGEVDVNGLNFVLGADGSKKFPLKDGVIDELKVYNKALLAAELETVYNPYRLDIRENEVTISWNELIEENIEPAYLVLNNEKIEIASGEKSKTITGLKPNEEYTLLLVSREKNNKNNYRDVYSFVFTTKSEEIKVGEIKNLKALNISKKSVKLGWEKPEEDYGLEGYIIYKDGKKIAEIDDINQVELQVERLNRHTIYNFKVAAKYSNGEISNKSSLTLRTAR